MTIIVNIQRQFPPSFFDGTNKLDKSISISEKLGLVSLIVSLGFDEKDLIRGKPAQFEPDFYTNNGMGFEITFADNRQPNDSGSITRIKSGQYSIQSIETDIIDSIIKSVEEKATKKQKGAYKNVPKISVFVICIEPLMYWYGHLHDFNYPHTQKKRNDFFFFLNQKFIESNIFENIYIFQITEFMTYVLYDLSVFAKNSDNCLTELAPMNLKAFPHCKIINRQQIDDGSMNITYKFHDVFYKYKNI